MARSNHRRRLLGAFIGVGLVPLAIACNSIVGLSDYEKAECSGGGSCIDTGSTDSPVTEGGGPDVRSDVIQVDASGTAPVSWVHFLMPNYAQPGDAGPKDNIQTYLPTAGGYQDQISKLVWREPIPPLEKGAKTHEEAKAICLAATPGKWRLPSRIELVTLLDLSKNPAIDPTFASTEGTAYWTSSEVRPPPPQTWGTMERRHWVVEFGTGGLNRLNIDTEKAAVRCIKDQ